MLFEITKVFIRWRISFMKHLMELLVFYETKRKWERFSENDINSNILPINWFKQFHFDLLKRFGFELSRKRSTFVGIGINYTVLLIWKMITIPMFLWTFPWNIQKCRFRRMENPCCPKPSANSRPILFKFCQALQFANSISSFITSFCNRATFIFC